MSNEPGEAYELRAHLSARREIRLTSYLGKRARRDEIARENCRNKATSERAAAKEKTKLGEECASTNLKSVRGPRDVAV
ncbi:hypothetical protein MTP99_010077 [Tenebrio molitor]|jgi:hypothetical protein|nr:hypothetical protein MTP99_010077 [Tenebrio molitor]